MPPKITPPSGSRPPTVKLPAPQSPAGVRGKPSPMKGTQNPGHWHVKLPKGKDRT